METECPECGEWISDDFLEENDRTCPYCGFEFDDADLDE